MILTRDKGLACRPLAANHLFIAHDRVREQVEQVLSAFSVTLHPLTRCSACNEPLAPLAKSDAKNLVPEYVFERHADFLLCPSCGRIYWKGSHVKRMAPEQAMLTKKARRA
jgi:uncharacterized protein with PIN domain